MHLDINDNTSLREIQLVFSNFYPYLHIKFYKKPHQEYQASEEKDEIEADRTIAAIRNTHISGVLEIRPLYKVSDVEKEFLQRFGISVQVLRMEKDGWVQTTGADDFTLKELNEMGRNSSDTIIVSEYEKGFEEPEEKPDKLY